MRLLVIGLSIFGFFLGGQRARAAKSAGTIRIGDAAPAFSLPAQDGKTYSSESLRGKKVVLYFYPKDQTPGCTKEACEFRDRNAEIQAKGAVVFGINTDSVDSHKKFAEKYHLTFPLLSDAKGEVVKAYGAKGAIGFAKRMTFVIDTNGRVSRIFPDVKVEGHSEEVLKALE